jgi:hypothetical protein
MRRSHFNKIFAVEVFHTYFERQICSCLQFSPGEITKQLQRRFGFILRNKVNGFELYADSRRPLSDYLKYITQTMGGSGFDFRIDIVNENFNLFTEFPIKWFGEISYDSDFNTISDTNGLVQLNQCLSETSPKDGSGKLFVHFDDILNYKTGENPVTFCIHFKARSTQWQYFVINRSRAQLNNPLVNGNDEIGFEAPRPVTIQTGEQALLFSSGENLIPLSAVPMYRFNLINNGTAVDDKARKSTGGKIVFKGLPNPEPTHINIVSIKGAKHFSSPMYVYI